MKRLLPSLLMACDLACLLAVYFISYVMAHAISVDLFAREFIPFFEQNHAWLELYLVQVVLTVGIFRHENHYSQRTPWWEQLRSILLTAAGMMLVGGFILYLFKLPFSRMWVISTWMLAVPALVLGRLLVRSVALRLGGWGTQVVLIGGPQNTLDTLFALKSDHYNSYRIGTIYLYQALTPIAADVLPPNSEPWRQELVKTTDLPRVLAACKGQSVIVAPDDTGQFNLIQQALMGMDSTLLEDIAFVPPVSGLSLYGMNVRHFFGSHTVLLMPKQRVKGPFYRMAKRAMDIAGALVGLLLVSGPLMLVALLVRRDGGSVFYYQERVGLHGKLFKCWKIRSMVPNAGDVLDSLLARDPLARVEWETDFKLKHDPRITRIGGIIRKTSIDELPQLWNVLKGDMSLVGPRPIVVKELDYYGKHRSDYLAAKPGLTGLWQVSGRNDTSYAYRVYLDSWYVHHWSFWTDIVIIIQTLGILLNRKGAY